jgi:hypothetical protein
VPQIEAIAISRYDGEREGSLVSNEDLGKAWKEGAIHGKYSSLRLDPGKL